MEEHPKMAIELAVNFYNSVSLQAVLELFHCASIHAMKEKALYEQVLGLERLRSEYQKCAGVNVSDLSILVKCLPKHIRQRIQLQMSDSSTYDSILSYVMSYEVTASWSTSRVHIVKLVRLEVLHHLAMQDSHQWKLMQ